MQRHETLWNFACYRRAITIGVGLTGFSSVLDSLLKIIHDLLYPQSYVQFGMYESEIDCTIFHIYHLSLSSISFLNKI